MEGIYPAFLCLLLLQTAGVAAQSVCSFSTPVNFAENNTVGAVVETIITEPGVVVTYSSDNDPNWPFDVVESQLIATAVLDYETMKSTFEVKITCIKEPAKQTSTVVVLLQNVNDNPPVFGQSVYPTTVKEMLPIDSPAGIQFDATDLDNSKLYYRLTPESTYFKLRIPTSSEILVKAILDYDKIKEVELVLEAQDTPLTTTSEEPSFTATTTIMVSILDVDNRPPWYEPCDKYEIGGNVVCPNAGYTGRVNLNEQETGVLPLKPGPLYAIDGDNGINEEITYSFLSGNEADLFEINPNTGNVTMRKPADVLGPISLTVLAAQRINSHQFATTVLTISVTVKSLHKPKFQRTLYEALITSKGSIALNANDNLPLEILATDEDYSSTGGRNPHITYSVEGSEDFSIVDGFLFLTNDLSDGTLSLQILAKDTTNDETATAQLSVELKLSSTTTSLPLSTTDIINTSVEESTTDSQTTNEIMSTTNEIMSTTNEIMSTTDEIMSTTNEIMSTTNEIMSTTDKMMSTTNEIMSTTNEMMSTTNEMMSTTNEIMSTTNEMMSTTNPTMSTGISATSHSVTKMPSGEFRVLDMVALGASLGVLLFISLVVIGLLVCYMQRGKADWKKIQEVAMFRSSLGQSSGGQKEGMQYTNEAFQKDDGDSMGSGGPNISGGYPPKSEWDKPPKDLRQGPSAPLASQLPDSASDNGSDKADDEKDVRPILTKERRVEEGYKSVWFKEDIDPNAKQEVVIIPDNREEESEGEDELSSRNKRPAKVGFADPDLDSGLGVKMEGLGEDSESDLDVNVDL